MTVPLNASAAAAAVFISTMTDPGKGDDSWNSPYSQLTQAIVWTVVAILSLETIIGNAMVIIAYKIERNISKQVSNRYIVSLAISDLIIGIEGFPLFTVYVLNGERWPLGAVTCETWLFLDYTLCLVSILTVLLITADRYLSVCHTAKYLKWQSPTKTQMLIVLSWVIPAVIFGVMIYGWSAMTGSAASMSGSECSAPFLTNPFVNMGMYVAYYWTTLVAMLILYKGIHQAAKNLEKKAKAKERRHIALILSQRLGTQVGVSLMLQSRKEKEEAEAAAAAAGGEVVDEARRDSGYHTAAAASTIQAESEQNLSVIQEERRSAVERESSRRSSRYSSNFEPPNTITESIALPTLSLKPSPPVLETVVVRTPSNGSLHRATIVRIDRENSVKEKLDRNDSLSLLFNEDDMSSVLHFKTPLHQADSTADSMCSTDTNVVAPGRTHSSKRRFRKSKRSSSHRSGRSSMKNGVNSKIARIQKTDSTSSDAQPPLLRVEVEDVCETKIEVPVITRPMTRGDRWVHSMRARISRVIERKRSFWRDRSPSCSSSSSSGELDDTANDRPPSRRRGSPADTQEAPAMTQGLAPPTRTDTFLSPAGVTRKISTFGSITRERMISTIFAPIISRGRKPTKAEKRAHKAFRTITFIVGFFAILWSPYYIMATIYGFCGSCINPVLYTLSYYMCYLNSSGNPFAYALANRQFRTTFLRMLRGNFNTQV